MEGIPSYEELLAKATPGLGNKRIWQVVERARTPNQANDMAESRRFKRENVLYCHALARIKKYYPDRYEELKTRRVKPVVKKVETPVSVPTPPKRNWRKMIYIGVASLVCLTLVLGVVLIRIGNDQKPSKQVANNAPTVNKNDSNPFYLHLVDKNGNEFYSEYLTRGQTVGIKIDAYKKMEGFTIVIADTETGAERNLASGIMVDTPNPKYRNRNGEDLLETTKFIEIPKDLPITVVKNGQEVRRKYDFCVYLSRFSSLNEAMNYCKGKGASFQVCFYQPILLHGLYLLEKEGDAPLLEILSPTADQKLAYGKPIPVRINCHNLVGKIQVDLNYWTENQDLPPSKEIIVFKDVSAEDGELNLELKDYLPYMKGIGSYQLLVEGKDVYGTEMSDRITVQLAKELD